MGSIGPLQLLIIAIVILVLFGRGRISEMMGDFGKGVKSFRKGMNDEEETTSKDKPSAQIQGPAHEAKPAGETIDGSAPTPAAAPASASTSDKSAS
ncbi:twin-arginine translocase TatA/TatE family subunit [Aurantiacibacter poecillastricola]|uniref:twin-arginine translocase TatA/TatE family subunit n=1 Tax=Aurantiacibacter poecillastricola TaxID=3064385 RepID=UPI00273FA0FB|nr:twin-arginine translocase TatA/TatE family subunit [Aurantiacibacter sp. 219JJ12-13]MDP5262843.1 twin-arginine translocase TatA/TatE family subunit [Aurantiacibacter sp. 219JJ12-13]